jgi:hypothetical protein
MRSYQYKTLDLNNIEKQFSNHSCITRIGHFQARSKSVKKNQTNPLLT